MSWTIGKTQVSQVVAVMDEEHDSMEDAAKAILKATERVFEDRTNFVVVGQLVGTSERSRIPPDDPEAIKVALGWYSTEGDARAACESLCYSSVTGDQFAVWVLPVFHGTAADLHAKQKQKYATAEANRKTATSERIQESIRTRALEAAERAAAGKGSCTCGHQKYDHSMVGNSRGKCWECECTAWDEKK